MIKFKDLSTGLKVLVVYGYISLAFNIAIFILGFIIGWNS